MTRSAEGPGTPLRDVIPLRRPESGTGTFGTANLLTGLGVAQIFTRTDSAGTRSFLADALGSTLALTDSAGVLSVGPEAHRFHAHARRSEAISSKLRSSPASWPVYSCHLLKMTSAYLGSSSISRPFRLRHEGKSIEFLVQGPDGTQIIPGKIVRAGWAPRPPAAPPQPF